MGQRGGCHVVYVFAAETRDGCLEMWLPQKSDTKKGENWEHFCGIRALSTISFVDSFVHPLTSQNARMVGLDRGFAGPRVNGQKQKSSRRAVAAALSAQSRNS
jgi:hypothetical protein